MTNLARNKNIIIEKYSAEIFDCLVLIQRYFHNFIVYFNGWNHPKTARIKVGDNKHVGVGLPIYGATTDIDYNFYAISFVDKKMYIDGVANGCAIDHEILEKHLIKLKLIEIVET